MIKHVSFGFMLSDRTRTAVLHFLRLRISSQMNTQESLVDCSTRDVQQCALDVAPGVTSNTSESLTLWVGAIYKNTPAPWLKQVGSTQGYAIHVLVLVTDHTTWKKTKKHAATAADYRDADGVDGLSERNGDMFSFAVWG